MKWPSTHGVSCTVELFAAHLFRVGATEHLNFYGGASRANGLLLHKKREDIAPRFVGEAATSFGKSNMFNFTSPNRTKFVLSTNTGETNLILVGCEVLGAIEPEGIRRAGAISRVKKVGIDCQQGAIEPIDVWGTRAAMSRGSPEGLVALCK